MRIKVDDAILYRGTIALIGILGIAVMVLAALAAPTVANLINHAYDLACTGVLYDTK